MTGIRIVDAESIRASVSFEDLIEPVSRAFEESSAGLADNGLVVMFPAERNELGDVYVKTGSLRGHDVYIVKVSPWFSSNVERGLPQGGFVGVFDSHTGRTLALLNEEHYLSDIRTAAAGALAARMLAPSNVKTAAVQGGYSRRARCRGARLLAAPGAVSRAAVHDIVDLGSQSAKGRAAQDPVEREVARRRDPLLVRYRTHSAQR